MAKILLSSSVNYSLLVQHSQRALVGCQEIRLHWQTQLSEAFVSLWYRQQTIIEFL